MYLHKRTFIRIISFFSVAVIALAVFGVYNYNQQNRIKNSLMSDYARSFTDLSAHLYNIETAFDKGRYAGTPYQAVRLASEVWRETGAAKSALEQMPVYDLNLQDVSAYLAKAGDYAYYLSAKLLREEELTDEEVENMNALADTASSLAAYIGGLQSEINDGNASLQQVLAVIDEHAGDQPADEGQGGDLTVSKEQVSGYPELIYDGPFSDHIEKMEPVFLQDKQLVGAEAAKKNIVNWLGVRAGEVELAYETASKIPAYVFNVGDRSVSVTKNGGYLLQITSSALSNDVRISNEDPVQYARDFLQKLGIEGMEESYYMLANGELTVNFAYTQDGVTMYPDLIKVSVSMRDGAVCGYEAFGYMMAHREDRDTRTAISMEEAEKSVSKRLTVTGRGVAVIPTDGKNEVLCYEFVTETPDGRHILVYVNANTGVEEMLQILIETEQGTLTA